MNKTLDRLIYHEGIELFPYKCTANKTTIGIGRNLESTGITELEARYLAKNDIDRVKRSLYKELDFFHSLDDDRKYILIDMAFQMGVNGLLKFKKMLHCIALSDYHGAAIEMLDSNWATQTKSRAERLAHLMKTLEWRL